MGVSRLCGRSVSRASFLGLCAAGGTVLLPGCAAPAPESSRPSEARLPELPGVAQVGDLPAGEVLWERGAGLADGSAPSYLTPVVHADGAVYTVASGDFSAALLGYDAERGDEVLRCELPSSRHRYAQLAVADGVAFAASGDGFIAAVSLADGSLLWQSQCAEGDWVTGYEKHPDGDGWEVEQVTSDVPWYLTELLVRDDFIVAGFSSYTVNPGSHLVCLGSVDGSLRWEASFEGRFVFDGEFQSFERLTDAVVWNGGATGSPLSFSDDGALYVTSTAGGCKVCAIG